MGSVMLERHRVHRDADGDLPAAVTAPLLAHPPSPAEPWPANFGSSEITDEEIDAASAACCRICLESESEPGEPPPQFTFSFLSLCAKQRIVGPCTIGSLSTFAVLLDHRCCRRRWIVCLNRLLGPYAHFATLIIAKALGSPGLLGVNVAKNH